MGKGIVKYRYVILIVFAAALAVACAFLPQMINRVNYDLTSYLPEGYDTYDGYQFVSEHFNIHGDVEIGVYTTYEKTAEIADEIGALDGVTSVTWADILGYLPEMGVFDKNDPKYIKLRSILTDAPVTDDGKAHNWAVLVTLKYPPSSTEAISLFRDIRTKLSEIAGADSFAMSGMTEQANALFETVFDELWLYCLIAGIVVLIILAATTNSLMEPVILIVTLVVSIMINLGSNAIFPSTSIITFACTAILQLGLSMDYAIFLLHQYRSELRVNCDPKIALSNAVPKSAKAVTASALTTIGGFLALLFMKFGIGSDLGLSLAKGIICSLLTVIFLQPCLMLMCEKARVKTQHKCLDVKFRTPVKHAIKSRGWVAVVIALLLLPAFFASDSLQFKYVKFLPPSTDTSQKQVMAESLGNQVMIIVPYKNDNYELDETGILGDKNYEFVRRIEALGEDKVSFVLGMFAMFPEGSTVKGEKISAMANETFDELEAQGVTEIKLGTITLPIATVRNMMNNMLTEENEAGETVFKDFSLPQLLELLDSYSNFLGPDVSIPGFDMSMISGYLANGYTMYTVGINPGIDLESKESFAILDEIKAIAADIFENEGYGKCYMTGITQAAYDFAKITPTDFMWVTIASILIILIILMLALGSVKLPILLVALIEFGIWINLAMQYIFAAGTVNFMSYLIISAVQLGATVDYAILISTKFKDLRKRFEPRQAAYMATTSSAMSIVTSALIMSGACFSVFGITTNLVIKEMTFLMARGALLSAILVIFILPAILAVTDKARGDEIHIPRTPKLRPYPFKSRIKKTAAADNSDK